MMASGKRTSRAQQEAHRRWTRLIVGQFVYLLALIYLASPAAAQTPQQPAPEAAKTVKQKPKSKSADEAVAKKIKKDPALAQQQIETGVAALQAGKVDSAVQQLTAAVTGGGLSPSQLARAQYHRGVAYRKQGKIAQALSDLTQALNIKNGLTGADRAEAMAARSATYRDAGLSDQEDAGGAAIGQRTASAGSTSPTRATGGAATAPAEPAPSGGGLGGFFGNLFGTSNAAPAPAAAPAAPAKSEVATSGWNSGTEVKPAAQQPATPGKAVPKPAKAATEVAKAPERQAPVATTGSIVQASTPTGRFALQVGQHKTRAEAEAAAQRIKQQFAGELAGRDANIDAVSQGGFGTLHRITFGPFVDPSEWKAICPKLLGAKHDCQPITR